MKHLFKLTSWQIGLVTRGFALVAWLYGMSFVLSILPGGAWYTLPTLFFTVGGQFMLVILTVSHVLSRRH